MYNKPVIVFEGIECSGKSLHIKNVCKYLKKKIFPIYTLENQVEVKIQRLSEN